MNSTSRASMHFLERIYERFGWMLNAHELDELGTKILQGKAIQVFGFNCVRGTEAWDVVVRNKVVRVIWAPKARMFITVLDQRHKPGHLKVTGKSRRGSRGKKARKRIPY